MDLGDSISQTNLKKLRDGGCQARSLLHKSPLDWHRNRCVLLHPAYQRRGPCIFGPRRIGNYAKFGGHSPTDDHMGHGLIFRYPGYRLQPYIGIGPSLYFAKLNGPDAPPGQSATSIGFNAEGGVRYYLTRKWTMFGEGKYNSALMNYSSNHSDPNADPFGFRATYSAFTLSLGVSYISDRHTTCHCLYLANQCGSV